MLPQSYDFISKPARAFWEKFLKKFRDCVFYVTGQGSICHDDKVAYRPFIVRCSFIVNIRYIDNNGSYCFKIS